MAAAPMLAEIAASCFADEIDHQPADVVVDEIMALVGAAAVLAGLHGVALAAVLEEAAAGHAHGCSMLRRSRQRPT